MRAEFSFDEQYICNDASAMVAAVKTENKTLSVIASTCVLSLSEASEHVAAMSTIVFILTLITPPYFP